MTIRISYDTVATQAEKIFIDALANNGDVMMAYKSYVEFIEGCGWDINSYNQEQLKRIDKDWGTDPQSN